MTELVIQLPDELEQRARSFGLLTSDAVQAMFEEALRREAGRRLLALGDEIQALGIPLMSMEDIDAEVKAVRAEKRAERARDTDAGRS